MHIVPTLLDNSDLRICALDSAHNSVSQHLFHLLLSYQRESTKTCLFGISMRRMILISLWPASTTLSSIACWRLLTPTKPCGTTWRQNIHPFSYLMKILRKRESCQPPVVMVKSSLFTQARQSESFACFLKMWSTSQPTLYKFTASKQKSQQQI